MTHGHDGEDAEHRHLCPTCQQALPLTKVDFVDVAKAVEADKLTEADVFRRTYIGHGTQSSVFVFQGHAGPFRSHVHVTHDEIGYVLEGSGSVTVGGFIATSRRSLRASLEPLAVLVVRVVDR